MKYSPGLYTPDDVSWKINSPLIMNVALGRAVILDICEPRVAAGVAQHSAYATAPMHRLLRTLRTSMGFYFGSDRQALGASRRYYKVHRPVSGKMVEGVGEISAGTEYQAADPDLRLWVFATAVDSILVGYEALIESLPDASKETYYEESKRLAYILGIPEAVYPANYARFRLYLEDMLSNHLAIGTDAREIIESLFQQTFTGRLTRISSHFGLGLLPSNLRNALGVEWTEIDQLWFLRMAEVSQVVHRVTPRLLLNHPLAILNQFRWTMSRAMGYRSQPSRWIRTPH